jgi:hypothetical protein
MWEGRIFLKPLRLAIQMLPGGQQYLKKRQTEKIDAKVCLFLYHVEKMHVFQLVPAVFE